MPRGHSLSRDDLCRLERLFHEGKKLKDIIRLTGITKQTVLKYRRLFQEDQPCTKTKTTDSEQ